MNDSFSLSFCRASSLARRKRWSSSSRTQPSTPPLARVHWPRAWPRSTKCSKSTRHPGHSMNCVLYELCVVHIFLDDSQPDLHSDPRPGAFMMIVTALQQPWSRGSVHISSTDPQAPPTIDPNFLSNPVDQSRAVLALQLVHQMSRTEPLKGAVKEEKGPGPKVPESSSYETWLNYARDVSATEREQLSISDRCPLLFLTAVFFPLRSRRPSDRHSTDDATRARRRGRP